MLSVSRQSQSRIVVLRLLQQGQVPGRCIGHCTSVKVVESHSSQHLEHHGQKVVQPNFHGIKRNTIFPTQMNRETPQDGLHQSGRVSFCRVHDQARRRPRFQLMALVQALHLTQLTRKVIHGCHPTSSLRRLSFSPATILQRPTLHQSIQALVTSYHNHTWQFSHCFQPVQVPRGSSPWMFVEKVYSTLCLTSIDGTAKAQVFDSLESRFTFVFDSG